MRDIPVFVLSVRTFLDRIAHVERELGKAGIGFNFIFEHDPDTLAACTGPLPVPHRSLVLKHKHAWQIACEEGHGRILVSEDDVLLNPDFTDRMQAVLDAAASLQPGWLIFLGGADTRVPRSFFRQDSILIPNPIATTEAYLTDAEACRRRLQWCERHPIDLPSDGLMKKMDAEIGIQQYWLQDAIVAQGSVTGQFESVLDGHRRKHSRAYNRARYLWSKFHRRTLPRWRARIGM